MQEIVFTRKKPSYTCGYMMIFGILPFGCESDMQRKKIKTQLNCSTSRQSEPSLAVLWFPHLTRSFKHRRCSSSHNSLRGIHPVTTTHTFHCNILLRSSSAHFYNVLIFPNNIYGQLGIYMLLFKQYKAV